jgi:hypothetical protein
MGKDLPKEMYMTYDYSITRLTSDMATDRVH